jgi:hypothetical protein
MAKGVGPRVESGWNGGGGRVGSYGIVEPIRNAGGLAGLESSAVMRLGVPP